MLENIESTSRREAVMARIPFNGHALQATVLTAIVVAGVACDGPVTHEPLCIAADRSDTHEVQRLLDAGIPPDTTDTGVTPLMTASRNGDLAIMRLLIDKGADVNRQDTYLNAWTPLLHALHTQQRAAVLLLLERGANPNTPGAGGETPLMLAAQDNDVTLVAALLARGADARARSGLGQTALDIAVAGGAFADPTDRSWLGGCYPETVRLLTAAAPQVSVRNGFGPLSARWWARVKGCSSTLALIDNTPGR
jgi:hypothetical protein